MFVSVCAQSPGGRGDPFVDGSPLNWFSSSVYVLTGDADLADSLSSRAAGEAGRKGGHSAVFALWQSSTLTGEEACSNAFLCHLLHCVEWVVGEAHPGTATAFARAGLPIHNVSVCLFALANVLRVLVRLRHVRVHVHVYVCLSVCACVVSVFALAIVECLCVCVVSVCALGIVVYVSVSVRVPLQVVLRWLRQGFWSVLPFPDLVLASLIIPLSCGIPWFVYVCVALVVAAGGRVSECVLRGEGVIACVKACTRLGSVDWATTAASMAALHDTYGSRVASALRTFL